VDISSSFPYVFIGFLSVLLKTIVFLSLSSLQLCFIHLHLFYAIKIYLILYVCLRLLAYTLCTWQILVLCLHTLNTRCSAVANTRRDTYTIGSASVICNDSVSQLIHRPMFVLTAPKELNCYFETSEPHAFTFNRSARLSQQHLGFLLREEFSTVSWRHRWFELVWNRPR